MLNELYLGRVRWDLLRPFPEQDADDRLAGEPVLAALGALLRARVDPAAVEDAGQLPDGVLEALGDAGFLRLMIDPQLGGLGLSLLNACRVIEAAATWSMPVAFALAISNGFGSGSYLPAIADGPLREMIAARVAQGIVSAGADAEGAGTANRTRTTVAIPIDGGAAYELSGEKLFIGNGPVADLMDVSATLRGADGSEQIRLFFVDTSSPGFHVVAWHEFMGLRGAAIGALRLDGVRVPAEHMLDESSDGWRMRPGPRTGPSDGHGSDGPADEPPDLARLAALGRMLVIAPASLAIAKLCLLWSRDFVGRRSIDGRNLGEYGEIQRLVSETASDLFTIETVAAWALLRRGEVDTQPDLTPVKNIASLACWRTVDRTMSLLGAEGYETARSKQRRGAVALPVERAFRDARALRVAGGVDFMLDVWSAQSALESSHAAADAGGDDERRAAAFDGEFLGPRGRDHVRHVDAQAQALAEARRRLSSAYAREEPLASQRSVATLGRIAAELLSMSLVLARADRLAARGNPVAADLADVACATSRRRLDELWPQLDEEPPFPRMAAAALHGSSLDFLLTDVVAPSDLSASRVESRPHA